MLKYDGERSFLWYVTRVRGSALSRIKWRLVAVFAMSVLLTYLAESHKIKSSLNPGALSVMGLALGIFLGFRNNTSYDRFWEGRKLWGSLVNTARSLSRQTVHFLTHPESGDALRTESESKDQVEKATCRTQIYRLIAYVHALRLHLRDEQSPDELARFLGPEDLKSVTSHQNIPNGIALLLSGGYARAAKQGLLSDYRWMELERGIVELTNIQGGCERIKSTPIPHSYSILIHRIVALYVFALPFGLVNTTHLYTPLVVLMVAYTFLALDAVGSEIEDPFGKQLNDLPLTTLCRMIEINLRQTLGETDLPPPLEPVDGYFE